MTTLALAFWGCKTQNTPTGVCVPAAASTRVSVNSAPGARRTLPGGAHSSTSAQAAQAAPGHRSSQSLTCSVTVTLRMRSGPSTVPSGSVSLC